MPKLFLFMSIMGVSILSGLFAADSKHGVMKGVINSESPSWFKDSFLEFEEDVSDAAASGRRVMIYFHQEGCPYCARLVNENFKDPDIESYIRTNFDGININLWGDREVISVAGRNFTEKTFAAALKVQFTPTLIFLDESGKVALRLNGYYPPETFRSALRFVAEKQEITSNFDEYLNRKEEQSAGALVEEPFFSHNRNLKELIQVGAKPLAVYFEKANCDACEIVHQKILTDAPTRKLVVEMNNVQLNRYSNELVTTPEGEILSAREWAEALNIGYLPSVVFFDESGQEVIRMNALFKTFHFQSIYAYVLEKGYLTEPSFQRYIAARGEAIREAGFDTDIDGYESSHQ
ncbi:MAG: thioredoxin-related protein [Gammaproteobacteria bacterium]